MRSKPNRRAFLAFSAASMATGLLSKILRAETPGGKALAGQPASPGPSQQDITWVSTTQHSPWRTLYGVRWGTPAADLFKRDVLVRLDQPQQEIKGFGGAFSEKGWQALQALPPAERARALDALFLPGAGTSFTVCRTPVGANDMSRGWYSYDETDGDFTLEHFNIDNDRETLIPFILAARERQPHLWLWASPWSPPSWMKTNRFYAMTPAWPGQPVNGIRPDQIGQEGHDYFIQDDRYFGAYARYFRRYVEEYTKVGIPISMVMPQNEFNSAQPFPSCCWTAEGLKRFIPHLGPQMAALGVEIFFGTLERPNAELLEEVLRDPAAGPYIKGVGVQWAGKHALEHIREHHPDLPIWASEQECGIGTNDWRYARYGWSLMKRFFNNGASVWDYWNMVVPEGGMSTWGWPQNSLLTVDARAGRLRFNHEYYLLRHLSQYVLPGARRVLTQSFFGYENQLAFRNPNGDVVTVVQNDLAEVQALNFEIGARQLSVALPPDSFNTLVVPAALLAT